MTHSEAAKALEGAELDTHLDRRDEATADDGGRRAAELAEWQRTVQLLAAISGPYPPDTDVIVQEELAEDRRREEAEQQRRQEQQQLADRAEELARLGPAGRPGRPRGRRRLSALLGAPAARCSPPSPAPAPPSTASSSSSGSDAQADPDSTNALATGLEAAAAVKGGLV
ncbi:hypothetical protein [Streptomyces sp. NPDC056337]|uniref:hypothetical protein n=1 Tax=Streptomyces sp. NPDC056337 TaxID=3345787 RepID=UPI0035D9517D